MLEGSRKPVLSSPIFTFSDPIGSLERSLIFFHNIRHIDLYFSNQRWTFFYMSAFLKHE